MNLKAILTIFFAALFIGGCATPEERARIQQKQSAQQRAQYEAVMVGLRDTCRQYGFREGTDKFAECVERESRAWVRRAEQARAEEEYRDRCYLDDRDICKDRQRQQTTCIRDGWGNYTCTTN